MKFLSWGCGVQSTTLAAMSALGELEPLDAVITADTCWETQPTYHIRDWYIGWLEEHDLPVEIVSGGDIRVKGTQNHINVPFWTANGGPLRRECTRYFKVIPVRKRIRELLGYHRSKPPHPPGGSAELWIGISLDEWTRARPSHVQYITHEWPLLKRKITREDCISWLMSHDLPIPPKSACVCCPYRRASEWLKLRQESPEDFAAAVEFDEANRHNPLSVREGGGGSTADALYIWKDPRTREPEPLAEANLERIAERERQRGSFQLPMFLCDSGYCWI